VIAAAVAMLVLSLGDVWSVMSRLDVPLLCVERVSTRFIVMPLMVWLIALMAGTHEWTNAPRGRGRAGDPQNEDPEG
jgi:hypothetical protein